MIWSLLALVLLSCGAPDDDPKQPPEAGLQAAPPAQPAPPVSPRLITEPVVSDSDDPAIWLHPEDLSKSLILGTDKGGGIYAFDLDGKIQPERSVTGLGRMNNVDVEYGLNLGGQKIDIAVATDRDGGVIRILRLPEMTPIDGGEIQVFVGESAEHQQPMGVALYRRPIDGTLFVTFSRKAGPSGSYLWQYRLEDDGSGSVRLVKVREFGEWSGREEIEAIAIDDGLGYLYYSDEGFGIRKYHADPDAPDANRELATFGTEGFAEDREGISIYPLPGRRGYILVSDQQAGEFRVFPREGAPDDPHRHDFITAIPTETIESDGSEVTAVSFSNKFPGGLFVAMSKERVFHYYAWKDLIAGRL